MVSFPAAYSAAGNGGLKAVKVFSVLPSKMLGDCAVGAALENYKSISTESSENYARSVRFRLMSIRSVISMIPSGFTSATAL